MFRQKNGHHDDVCNKINCINRTQNLAMFGKTWSNFGTNSPTYYKEMGHFNYLEERTGVTNDILFFDELP